MDQENHPRWLAKGNHSPLLEEQRKLGGMLKPSRHNPTLHPRKAVCNDPLGAHQTNLPQPSPPWTSWFHCWTKYNRTNFRNSSNHLISLPTLLLSTSKLPLTQCPVTVVTPCGKFFKSVAFHRNFLFLCVDCTQTPAAQCASLLLCQKSSPSRLAWSKVVSLHQTSSTV